MEIDEYNRTIPNTKLSTLVSAETAIVAPINAPTAETIPSNMETRRLVNPFRK
jgi:hypothetical protein